MARRRKNGFDTTMLAKYGDRLEAAGGTAAVKRAVEGGMKSAKQEVIREVTTLMQPGNLPAGGKYSTGDTMEHLNRELVVKWEGNMARLGLGFVLDQGGLTSIFLMYGTPHHPPVAGLEDVLRGNKLRKITRKEQEKAILKVLERLGE